MAKLVFESQQSASRLTFNCHLTASHDSPPPLHPCMSVSKQHIGDSRLGSMSNLSYFSNICYITWVRWSITRTETGPLNLEKSHLLLRKCDLIAPPKQNKNKTTNKYHLRGMTNYIFLFLETRRIQKQGHERNKLQGLEKHLSSQNNLLFFQRSQVQISALTLDS